MKKSKIRRFAVIIIGIIITIFVFSFMYFKYRPDRPNILLITVDALRPDHLSCYRYKRNTSPNIDKLAREGVLFTQAISQASWTLPSLASLITSTYPSKHGVVYWNSYLDSSLPSLPLTLKKANYYTKLISGHDNVLFAILGLDQSFDNWNIDGIEISAEEITKRAINFLRENRNKKFFLWLHYMDVHGPYKPPPPYNKKYLDDSFYTQNKNISISTEKEHIYQGAGVIPSYIAEKGITEGKYYIAQYDGGISFADEQIGVLLEELEELGLDRKTIIILTADHGEAMGEHNIYFTHGAYLYDEYIKVPLILKYSNILPFGKLINHQIGLIDVMPTILDILGIQAKIKTSGISLLPMILKGKSYPSRIIFSEFFSENHSNISLRSSEWKLIYTYNPQEENYELYNLKTDPQELNNLVEIEKEQVELLKAKLDEWMNRPKPDITPLTKPLDEETKERLRSLGYLQ